MKVRSITYFCSASSLDEALGNAKAAKSSLKIAKEVLHDAGFEVQTTRLATNSFEDFLPDNGVQDAIDALQQLETASEGIDFISVGTAEKRLDVVEAALGGHTDKTFFVCPLPLTSAGVPNYDTALNIAKLVCRLGAAAPAKTTEVPTLFRTTVTGNLDAGTPYFPGAYWRKGAPPAIALALEDSGLFVKGFEGQTSLDEAQASLNTTLRDALVPLEAAGKAAAKAAGVDYSGIDCSLASSAEPAESMVKAFESLGLGPVGGPGTLSICAMITSVLKKLPVTHCGYSGIMLPVTEDAGLAERASEKRLSVQQLLFYSSVCGTGIDTVPIEGSTAPERLAMTYVDMASLAFRLKKPLSARLWPVAGKKAGDMTEVDNPFFVNTKVLALDAVATTIPQPPLVPSAAAEGVAGIGGEASLVTNTPEVVVVRLAPDSSGVAFVLRNSGSSIWPDGLQMHVLHAELQSVVTEVPSAAPGQCVTVALLEKSGSFRLSGPSGPFGPVLVVIS